MKNKEKTISCAKAKSTERVFVWLVGIAAAWLLITWAVSKGENVPITFFGNLRDTGMDFFNSICHTDGRVPYTEYSTLYPPLANLFFFLLRKLIPMGVPIGDAPGLRGYQAPLLLFVLFVVASVLLSIAAYERFYERDEKIGIFSIACFFCFGNLYALERGNIIVLALVLTFFFFTFYQSKNRLLSELALVALALAAGLKIYPALFGLLLLKDREWKKAGRAVIYGLICFILPFFAFEGLEGMRIFFGQLVRMNTSSDALYGSVGVSGIMMAGFKWLGSFWDVPYLLQDAITWTVKLLAVAILLTSFFLSKSRWQQYLDLTLLLVLFQTSYYYTLSFFLIPFIAYCRENEKLERRNIAAFVFFMIVLLPYPAFTIHKVYSTRYFLVVLAMGIAVILETVCMMKALLYTNQGVIKN